MRPKAAGTRTEAQARSAKKEAKQASQRRRSAAPKNRAKRQAAGDLRGHAQQQKLRSKQGRSAKKEPKQAEARQDPEASNKTKRNKRK